MIRITNNYNKSVIFFQKTIDNTKSYIKIEENKTIIILVMLINR